MRVGTLNELQQRAYDAVVKQKKNIFLTGSGGCGKSYCIGEIVFALREQSIKVAITASTGSAAILIGGATVHSWSGCNLFGGTAESLAKNILENPQKQTAKMHWLETDVLIIDEISMIDGEVFDKLEEVARLVRKRQAPFGGVRIVLCGDFAQLPPVKPIGGFCFEAKCWSSVVIPENQIQLVKVVRQSEANFVKALSEIRLGKVTPESIALLRPRVGAKVGTDIIKPTVLLSRRIDVQNKNKDELDKIPGPSTDIPAQDGFSPYTPSSKKQKDDITKIMNRDLQAPPILSLKIGAQVMLIKNHSETLVNGSRGVVVGFDVSTKLPVVQFMNGQVMITERHRWRVKVGEKLFFERYQVPLILAWCITIHKCQGATLDCAEIEIGGCFEHGQAYVALSRVRSLDGLSLKGYDLSKITVNPKVRAFYGQLDEYNTRYDIVIPKKKVVASPTTTVKHSVKREQPEIVPTAQAVSPTVTVRKKRNVELISLKPNK